MPAKPPLWHRLLSALGLRGYDAAKHNNHVWGGPRVGSSSNAEVDLTAARPMLRQRARNADQNSPTARAIVEALAGLIVSSGIDVYPDSGDTSDDTSLREVFAEWAESASACGRLSLWELQRQAVRGLPTAGEWLWLIVDAPDRPVPFAIQPLEPDQLSPTPVAPLDKGNRFIDGVEIDPYGRPRWYHLTNSPQESSGPFGGTLVASSGGISGTQLTESNAITGRVTADDIIHGFEIRRPSQVRGEPWLAPILGTLRQELQLVEAELTAAKIGAAPAMAITSPSIGNDTAASGTLDLEPGSVARLLPGEDVRVLKNERPSQGIAPFRQMLRGDMAGAMRIPQRLIDRDVSRANYSSMRADMLDTRRQLDPVQQWIGRLAAARVYQRGWVQFAVAAGVTIAPANTPKRARQMRCTIHPDGWQYVDPEKDVRAATAAISAGLSTWTDEIGRRGGDRAKIWGQLKKDADNAEAMGLQLDLSGTNAPAPQSSAGLIAPVAPPAAPETESPQKSRSSTTDDMHPDQFHDLMRAIAANGSTQPHQTINNIRMELPKEVIAMMPAPVVNIQAAAPVVIPAPQVRIDSPAAQVVVNVPQQSAPVVNIQAAAPVVVPAPQVTVENTVEMPARVVRAVPQRDGSVLMTPEGA